MHTSASEPSNDEVRLRARAAAVLASLDEEQRAAAAAIQGPSFVLAAAGTGKSRVLAHQLAHVVALGLTPRRVLAVAATPAGAQKLRARAERLLGAPLHGAWVGTMRDVCLKILRAHAAALGRKSTFAVLDEAHARQLIRRVAGQLGVDLDAHTPARLQQGIDAVKTQGIEPSGVIAEVLPAYDAALREANAFDTGDLVLHVLGLLEENEALHRKYRRRFEQIFVDDYQDTSAQERRLLSVLAGAEGNVHVAADPDQAWAPVSAPEPPSALTFLCDFPGAQRFTLTRNYRSSGRIVYVAGRVASANPGEHAPMQAVRKKGSRVVSIATGDESEEAQVTVAWIQRMYMRGQTPSLGRVAILVRQPAQLRAFEECLVRAGIPYRVASGPRFYERREIKDVLAYLRLTFPGGSPRALSRISNAPRRGIGPASVRTIARLQQKWKIGMAEAAMRAASLPRVTAARAGALADLGQLLRDLEEAARRMSTVELIDFVVARSGYGAMLRELSSAEEETRREGIDELRGMARAFPGPAAEALPKLFGRVALVGGAPWITEGVAGVPAPVVQPAPEASDDDDDDDDGPARWRSTFRGAAHYNQKGSEDAGVQLLTYLDARGTEFDVVFLSGMEEEIFPSRRAIQGGPAAVDAERRLCYVAMTRARDRLVFLRTLCRTIQGEVRYGEPSRFLREAGRRVRHFRAGKARPGLGPRPSPDASTPAPAILTVVHEGQRVLHGRYGRGVVIGIDQTGPRAFVVVRFDETGEKRLALELARLQPA